MKPAEAALRALVVAHGPIRIAAAGDFHLGDGSERDDFGTPERCRLAEECTWLAPHTHASGAWVILLGDVIDGMRYPFAACVEAHRPELLWLANLAPPGDDFGTVFVVGNHDAEASPATVPDVPFHYCREVVADGWLCFHGDSLDPEPSLWRKVGAWGCRALAWLGKRSPAWEDRVQGWIDRLEARGRHGVPDAYEAQAVAVAKWMGCVGAAQGHTHVAVLHADYVNPGSWLTGDGWLLRFTDGSWHRWRA